MKKVLALILAVCMMAVMTGCVFSASQTLTYNVDNGDSIKVKLKTSEGLSMDAESPFSIYKDGEVITQGTFINSSSYGEYYEVVTSGEAELLEENTKDGIEYIFWKYDAGDWQEYNYAILVSGTNTGLLLANSTSEESAREVFDSLTRNPMYLN